ncbi:hypothetical protein SPFL3102_01489 [Sporomusaceae bacterium FL31]|nr:hypothetical protein SPFL3101_03122 [Sporomusaceae bacterium FL31]GCE33681.1 hypothetical protein SPFL3102_01489 [Sporomusaceae bacterium]
MTDQKLLLVQKQSNRRLTNTVSILAKQPHPIIKNQVDHDITLVSIRNPFDCTDREIVKLAYSSILTLAGYLRQSSIYDEQIEFVVSVNGGLVDPLDWDTTTVYPGAFIAICPVVGKGGGKNILGIIAGIALSVVTMGVGNVASGLTWAGANAAGTMVGVAGWTFGGFMAATATMYLGGMLISHFTPQPKIDVPQQETPTYSWGRIQSLSGQGNPISITYGTVKTAGQIIAQHVSSDGDKQYLNILLAAGDGPLDEITGIEINDNDISNYQGVNVEVRMGTNDQEPITNFSDQWADKALSYNLGTVNQYAIDQTDGNACQGLEISIEFPGGLYHIDDNGNTTSANVKIQAQYRPTGATNWTDWSTWTIGDAKTSGVRRTFRLDNLPACQYEVRVQCTHRSGSTTRDGTTPYWTQLSGIMYDDFVRPGRALLGIKALATDQLSGGVPSITWIQKRLNVWIWDPTANNGSGAYVQKAADNPAWASYDLIHRAKRLSDVRGNTWNNAGTTVTGNLVISTAVGQIVTFTRTAGTSDLRPGDRLQHNVSGVNFGTIINTNGNNIVILTESTWTVLTGVSFKIFRRPSSFQALGAPAGRIIYQDFKDWADYCESKNLKVNILLDKAGDLWTILKELEGVGRGKVILKGTRFSCICDKPSMPVQLYTMGNIVAGSFKEEFLAVRDRANSIEVSFNNEAKNYQRDTLIAYSDDWNINNTIKNPTQITLNGITSWDQAYAEAAYRLRLNKYLIRTVHFEAAIDAIACQVGDVILVQHDVPRWGAGGRLLAVNEQPSKNYVKANVTAAPWFDYVNGTATGTRSYGYDAAINANYCSLQKTDASVNRYGRGIAVSGFSGSQYTYSVYVRPKTSTGQIVLYVDAAKAEGGLNIASKSIPLANLPLNVWTRVSVTSGVGQLLGTAACYVWLDTAIGTCDFALPQIEIGSVLTPYVEGERFEAINRITGTTNLALVGADQFSLLTGVNAAAVTSGQVAPDGSATAYLLNDSSVTVSQAQAIANRSIAVNYNPYTLSIYLKQGTAPQTLVNFNLLGGTAQYRDIVINWATKTAVNGILSSVGNGWYLLTATVSNNGTNTTLSSTIYPAAYSEGGTTTGSVYAWQPQVEVGGKKSAYVMPGSTRPDQDEIRLDRTVDLDPIKNYEIMVRIGATDELIKKSVIVPSVATTTDRLLLSDTFLTAPADLDVYTFGASNMSAKPFRVVNISRSIDQNRRITALEYVDDVYQDSAVIPSDPFADNWAAVRSINVTQSMDPNYNTMLNISWVPPRNNYGGAIVLVDGIQIYKAGINETSTSVLAPDAKAYTITVIGIDLLGRQGSSVTTSYTVTTANNGALPNVPGLTLIQQGDQIQAIITTLISNKVKYYELRQGATWESGTLVRKILDDRVAFPAPQNGTNTYWIKANDGVGGESAEATGASINISGLAARNVMLTRLESMSNWTKTGMITRNDGALSIQYQKAVGQFLKFSNMFGGAAKLRSDSSIIFPPLDLGANIIVGGDLYTAPDGTKKIRSIESLSDFAYFARIFKSTLHYNAVTYANETFAGVNVDYSINDQIKLDVYYRVSIDGQVWGNWIPAASKQFFGRYIQPKLIISSLDDITNTKISGAMTTIDVPDLVESVMDIAIPAAKTRVNLTKAFTAIDTIAPFTQDISGIQCPYRISNITLSPPGFDVELLSNGNLVAGKITKCDIRGY